VNLWQVNGISKLAEHAFQKKGVDGNYRYVRNDISPKRIRAAFSFHLLLFCFRDSVIFNVVGDLPICADYLAKLASD